PADRVAGRWLGARRARQHRGGYRRGGPRGTRRAEARLNARQPANRKEHDMSLPNVVLVHGAWADGSSWAAVIERLQARGYHVTAPQFPMTTLADNVARLRQVLAVQDGPAIV